MSKTAFQDQIKPLLNSAVRETNMPPLPKDDHWIEKPLDIYRQMVNHYKFFGRQTNFS